MYLKKCYHFVGLILTNLRINNMVSKQCLMLNDIKSIFA